ncbi:hypothetical protein FGG79_19715 [Bacillus sp. BHET2]|uniref:hypothetical protein n=1 Tax=Bacillus sp. BHET2 TaxID=2583818 RepID=UPI001486B3CD|nr:hypothetical protein [Bacillus sp. BHET2]TMU83438.1 hypothetical protein FGG79_19715 [Bacillus sp. BHET2]
MKKTLILGATTMITIGAFNGSLTTFAHASESPTNEITKLSGASLTEDASASISEVAPYIHKDSKGFLYVDSNIPRDIYINNKVELLEESFKEINMQVANGQVVINGDLSITNKSNFKTFASAKASKGYTSKTYWWGERATYTNSQTKTAVQQLQDAAIHEGFVAAALFWLPPIAGVGGITGAYCGKLASSMKSHNKGKGVILDMTWVLAYSVKSR